MDFLFAGDRDILKELGSRVRRARLEMNISQLNLAQQAGVAVGVVQNFEAGEACSLKSFIRMLRVTHNLANLALLVPEPLPSPIEVAKMSGRQRCRAGAPKTKKDRV